MDAAVTIADIVDFRPVRTHVPEPINERRRYRTIWISDVHLGTRGVYIPAITTRCSASSRV